MNIVSVVVHCVSSKHGTLISVEEAAVGITTPKPA